MASNEPQFESIHSSAEAANEIAHKLHRQIGSVYQWLNNQDGSMKDGTCEAVVQRPLDLVADTRSILFDTVTVFANVAKHIGAPVCE